jgi:hypothetical protein
MVHSSLLIEEAMNYEPNLYGDSYNSRFARFHEV